MKYRIFALMSMLALTAASVLQAQDYDDIYYDASKSTTSAKSVKVAKPAKTVAVYGEVPEQYKVAANSNYRVERDEDEYNRRGAYELQAQPQFEVDINGDTIMLDSTYLEVDAFANTRRIERFYNPDVVVLSDDDDLIELYYDESPTINLIVGSDYGLGYSYASTYYPWYTGWYEPWFSSYYSPYFGWYDPWISTFSPWHYGYYGYYGLYNWHYRGPTLWGWNYWGIRPWHNSYYGHHYGWYDWTGNHHHGRPGGHTYGGGGRSRIDRSGVGLSGNRNGRSRVGGQSPTRNAISPRGTTDGNRPSVGGTVTRTRTRGYASDRGSGGNMGTRGTSGVTTRHSGISRNGTSSAGSSRSYSGSSSSGSSRSYSGGSRSYSGGSSSRSSGGSSYSGGSRGSSGGGSYGGSSGGSSGGGGRRR